MAKTNTDNTLVFEEKHIAEPYAVLSDDNMVLTFYFDGMKESRNGLSIGPFNKEDIRWNGCYSDIITVVFEDSFAISELS